VKTASIEPYAQKKMNGYRKYQERRTISLAGALVFGWRTIL